MMGSDKLICCDAFGSNNIEEGKEYTISSFDGERYYIEGYGKYMMWRFCTVDKWRSIKINRILNGV